MTRNLRRLRGVILIAVALLAYWLLVMRPAEITRRQLEDAREEHATGHTAWQPTLDEADAQLATQSQNLDAHSAGWESEVATEAISKRLAKLRTALQGEDHAASSFLPGFVTKDFQAQLLEPDAFKVMRDDAVWRIRRFREDTAAKLDGTTALSDFLASVPQNDVHVTRRVDFKIVGIEQQPNETTSVVLVEWVTANETHLAQTNMTWRMKWATAGETKHAPQLLEIQVAACDHVELRSSASPLLQDVTSAVLGRVSGFRQQVLRGIDDWSRRLSKIDDMDIYGHHGIAIGDTNGDGRDDVYVCDGGGLPNRLYEQQPDGTLIDVSDRSNTDWLESSSAALLLDLDNDGDQDLVVATVAGLIIAANRGNGDFEIRTARPGTSETQSLCAADYDNDGDLDLYLSVYGPNSSSQAARGFEAAAPIPYHDANNGGRNILLKNQGEFEFVDVTDAVGLNNNNQRFSFAASWEDYDVDGDMDLYVANDFGRNNLYRNDQGEFQDVAPQAGVEDMAGGMSVSWGDVNSDGRMDLYIGNMFSAAGNRVTFQRKFLAGRTDDDARHVQRMARGNTLFMQTEQHEFADVSEASGVTMGRWAWGSRFADLDNDGRLDLVVANGYLTNHQTNDL